MSAQRPWRIVHSEASMGWGGQEHRVLAELKGFQNRGGWVALLAPEKSVIFQRAKDVGIPARHLDTKKIRYPINAFRLKRWLRENEVQVVNTHSSRDGYVVGAAARLAKTPLLIRSRHIDVTYPNRWASRHAFTSLADHVVTTSQKITHHLSETFQLAEDRVTTVPTGIELETFTPDGPRADLFGVDSKGGKNLPIVGMVSVLRSWKGHPYFLEASKLLKDRGVGARFVIVGEGPQRENINAKIADLGLKPDEEVTLAGHREDVPAVLRSLAALAIPSTGHEGIPQIGLQALATKTPIVGSDAGGIPEIVRSGETGRIFPACDAKALAAAIEATLTQAEETRRFTENGRKLVEREHSLDHMLDRLEGIYSRRLNIE
jgi:glycosyltransferase involved in cell wall biosynthesis